MRKWRERCLGHGGCKFPYVRVPLLLPFTMCFTIMPGSEENAHAVCRAMCPGEVLKLSRKHPGLWTVALDGEKCLAACC